MPSQDSNSTLGYKEQATPKATPKAPANTKTDIGRPFVRGSMRKRSSKS